MNKYVYSNKYRVGIAPSRGWGRTMGDIYNMEDFWGVGEVKWNAIKHLRPIEFQQLYDTNVTKSPRLIGYHVYTGILLEIHEDDLCSNCKWCRFDFKRGRKSNEKIYKHNG